MKSYFDMNIQEEFEHLKAGISNDDGWQRLEDAWQVALNYEKRDGQWYKKADSMGDRVTGFAIDPLTRKYIIGHQGRDHHKPQLDLMVRLVEEKDVPDLDKAQWRVIKGHLAQVEGFTFPLLLLNGMWDDHYRELEAFILEAGIGLPIRELFEERYPTRRRDSADRTR